MKLQSQKDLAQKAESSSRPDGLSKQLGSAFARTKRSRTLAACALLALTLSALAINSSISKSKSSHELNMATVQCAPVTMRITASGSVVPEREVKISPKQAGLIKRLLVKQGDFVKKGQLLVVMDNSNLRGQVESADGAYQSAWQNYLKAKRGNRPQEIAQYEAQFERAKSSLVSAGISIEKMKAQVKSQQATVRKDQEYARRQTILAAEGAISAQEALNAETQAEVSQEQARIVTEELEQAKESYKQAQAELRKMQQQLDLVRAGSREEEVEAAKQAALQQRGTMNYLRSLEADTFIRAPFDGQIIQKYADEGAFVTPSAAAATSSATSSSVVVLAGTLEVVAQVPESSIANIRVGQEVEIIATALSKRRFSGKVSQIAPAAVASSNVTVFEVHIKLDKNAVKELRSGMNVSTAFICGVQKNALTIPAVCAVSKDGKRGVFIADKENKPQFKPVEFGEYLGSDSGSEIVVASGLSPGQKIYRGLSDSQIQENGFGGKFKPPFSGK